VAQATRTIPHALRAAVAQHGDRLAFRDGDRSLTYRELDTSTNAIAQQVLALDDRRPLVVVAQLDVTTIQVLHGSVKAGRLTIPLDPRWPREQWLAVTRETGGRLVVPDDATRALLPAATARDALVTSDLLDGEGEDPCLDLDPDDPTFVFFTSGSTGAPKGTVLTHAFVDTALGLMRMEPGDRLAVVSPLSFITGSLAAFGAPLTGASGHVRDVSAIDPEAISRWLVEEQITMLGLPPTVVRLIARAALDGVGPIESVRLIVHGGEVGTSEHFALTRRAFPNAVLVNAYGMTESGGAGCQHEIDAEAVARGGALPVGRPLPGVRIEIIDDDGAPVPDGEVGEIRITARRVALGYWNQPALTAERFSVSADGLRSVRTGDRGRIGPDGVLEHLGRADRRVKVHGQLVDLAEVEHELERLPEVRAAVVSSVPTDDGTARLVAHVVIETGHSVTVGALRRAVADRLPPYAIPRAFFRVEEVPRAITGKVDRAALRESAVGALPIETEFVAPRDATEQAVAALFVEVLAVERVGVHDDFFELGGDSLSAVELLAGLGENLGLELSAGELLRSATVEAIARQVEAERPTASPTVVRVNRAEGVAVFAVPGGGDGPLQFRALGRRLDDVALWAFQYRGLEGRALPDRSVRAIARRNVSALRDVDPVGPYRLLGYSFGGAVALEMAQQLRAAGKDVELLALLEPPFVGERETLGERTRAFATRAHEESPAGSQVALARVRALSRALVGYATRQVSLASAGLVQRRGVAQHELFLQLHFRVLRAYQPAPYRGRNVVFASPRFLADHGEAIDRVLPPERAGGQRLDVLIDGEHLDLVREPNVAEVARALAMLVSDPH
jgi:amino acid adenylation domain-containing protein